MRLVLSLAFASVIGFAPQAATGAAETKHLRLTTSLVKTQAAGKVSLVVDVTPKPTMHVYAPGQKGYIAVTLKLAANPAVIIKAAPARFPKPQTLVFKELNETQLVYSKPFRITQDVTVVSGKASDPLTIAGTLHYQACDDTICYTPVSVPVSWTIARSDNPNALTRR